VLSPGRVDIPVHLLSHASVLRFSTQMTANALRSRKWPQMFRFKNVE